MLAKKFKLPIQTAVGKKGKVLKTPFFLVKIFSSALDFSRFGVVVSSKISKKATERNRLKRRVYDFLRAEGGKLPAADYWISVLGSAAGLPKDKFVGELKKALNL